MFGCVFSLNEIDFQVFVHLFVVLLCDPVTLTQNLQVKLALKRNSGKKSQTANE